MKNKLIAILILMPLVALAQTDLNTQKTEKHPTLNTSNSSHRNIETTLLNDIPKSKSILGFDLSKSSDVSLTTINVKTVNYIDEQKLDRMLFEVSPLMDPKLQLIKPTDTKKPIGN